MSTRNHYTTLIILLLCHATFADRVILRGLYDGSSELIAKNDYTYLGSYIKETDKYAIDSVFGVGAEYEFVSQTQKGLACGLGYNYYSDRKSPSVKVSGTIDGIPISGTLTQDDATLHYTYAFLNFRFYPLASYYLGLQYRIPSVAFLGSSWIAETTAVQSSYALLLGYTKDNSIAVEVAIAQNSFLVDGVKTTFPVTSFSLGYAFPTHTTRRNANSEGLSNDELKNRLLNLDALHQDGIITDEEYSFRRKAIIDSL